MWHHLLEDSALKNGSRVLPLCCALSSMLLLCLQAPPAGAQSEFTLSQRIRKIIDRPEFAHANFAIEFYSLAAAPEAAEQVAGQTLGEIAAAAYDANLVTGAIAGDYDLIIRNGHIIDGTRNPWYAADVAVSGDRLAAIGDLREAHAKREIDPKGRIVAPPASLKCSASPLLSVSPRAKNWKRPMSTLPIF